MERLLVEGNTSRQYFISSLDASALDEQPPTSATAMMNAIHFGSEKWRYDNDDHIKSTLLLRANVFIRDIQQSTNPTDMTHALNAIRQVLINEFQCSLAAAECMQTNNAPPQYSCGETSFPSMPSTWTHACTLAFFAAQRTSGASGVRLAAHEHSPEFSSGDSRIGSLNDR